MTNKNGFKTASESDIDTNEKFVENKIRKINSCLERNDVDLWELRELALTKGGFINAELRRKAWHKLACIDRYSESMKTELFSSSSWEEGVQENEIDLIKRDVGRAVFFRYSKQDLANNRDKESNSSSHLEHSTIHTTISGEVMHLDQKQVGSFDSTSDESVPIPSLEVVHIDKNKNIISEESEEQKEQNLLAKQKEVLTSIIVRAIAQRPHLQKEQKRRIHYYQGFHDVTSLFYLIYQKKTHLSAAILRKLAKGHLRDATQQDFSNVMTLLEIIFFPILQIINEELHDYFVYRDLGPTVIMPWIITWFAHDIHDAECASRLFDAFLASHPLMPVYFSIALLVHPHNTDKLMDVDDDPAMLHVAINGLVRGISNDFTEGQSVVTYQDLIDDAISFMRRIPPHSLLNVAKNYDELLQSPQITAKAELISFLKPSPKWAIKNTVPADWVLKKQDIELAQSVSDLKSTRSNASSVSRSSKLQKQVSKKVKGAISTTKVGVISKQKKSEKKVDEYLKAKTAAGIKLNDESDNMMSSQGMIRSIFGLLGKIVTNVNKKSKIKRIQ